MEGVAANVIFIFLTIGMLIFVALLIFWRWMDIQNMAATETSCKNKQISYCIALLNKENPNWEDINPKTGCEKIGITKPSEDECKSLLK